MKLLTTSLTAVFMAAALAGCATTAPGKDAATTAQSQTEKTAKTPAPKSADEDEDCSGTRATGSRLGVKRC